MINQAVTYNHVLFTTKNEYDKLQIKFVHSDKHNHILCELLEK